MDCHLTDLEDIYIIVFIWNMIQLKIIQQVLEPILQFSSTKTASYWF